MDLKSDKYDVFLGTRVSTFSWRFTKTVCSEAEIENKRCCVKIVVFIEKKDI